jgi:hypothetical protein
MILATVVTILVTAFVLGLLVGVADLLVGGGNFFGSAGLSFLGLAAFGFVLWGAFSLLAWVWSIA